MNLNFTKEQLLKALTFTNNELGELDIVTEYEINYFYSLIAEKVIKFVESRNDCGGCLPISTDYCGTCGQRL